MAAVQRSAVGRGSSRVASGEGQVSFVSSSGSWLGRVVRMRCLLALARVSLPLWVFGERGIGG